VIDTHSPARVESAVVRRADLRRQTVTALALSDLLSRQADGREAMAQLGAECEMQWLTVRLANDRK
jgi:hypothetical protein